MSTTTLKRKGATMLKRKSATMLKRKSATMLKTRIFHAVDGAWIGMSKARILARKERARRRRA